MSRTIFIWGGLGLFAAAFSLSPAGQWIEHTVVREWIFEFRGVRPAPKDVLIVSMDKRGADLPTLGSGNRLWSRYQYSSLINRLSDAEAAGIVLDVTFEGVSEVAADSALEASLVRSNRVVMFQRLTRIDDHDIPVVPLSRFASVARAQAVFPLPKLSRVDGYWPFFPVREMENSAVRYRELPSLPVAAAQLRLLDEIGITPFEKMLGSSLFKEMISIDADRSSQGDVSSLISNLRAMIMGNGISDDFVDKLISGHIKGGSPTATMLRSLIKIYGGNGLLPLNFYGPARTIATIDHMDILNEESDNIQSLRSEVSGKMIFIGHSSRTAVDQRDGFRTVYTRDGLDLSGVEIAATAYANLIDGSMLQPLSIPLTILLHVLLGIVVAAIALRVGMLKAVIFTVVLVSVYLVLAMLLFVNAYRMLPICVPLFFLLPFTLFTAVLIRYFGTSRQAGVYRHGIQQLLPSRVMADIESGHLEKADRVSLFGTCMMSDVANFTHYTEEQGHESMGNLSREYFSLVMDGIYSSGGELFDVEGDGLTAFWDHATLNVEDGQRVASAALQITRNITDFNQRHPYAPFHTRIGIDSGGVEATYIGGEDNRRYCLVGDVTNTCSRLEGLNKRLNTSVLASKDVVSKACSLLLRPVGVFLLKGKSNTIEVFEVMNFQTSATVEERALCKHFAKAMELIGQGKYEVAENILVDILLNYGTDGPARFYLDLLNGNSAPEVQLEERGVVRVDGK